MAPVQAFDGYYLASTILITFGYQMLGFTIAWGFQVRHLQLFVDVRQLGVSHARIAHQIDKILT